MKTHPERIDAYLRTLERALWLRGLADADTLAEIESHLREAVEQGQLRGLSPEEAERDCRKTILVREQIPVRQ